MANVLLLSMKTANEPGREPFTSLLFQVEVRAWQAVRSDPIPGQASFQGLLCEASKKAVLAKLQV